MTPQRTPAREIRAHWNHTQRRALGLLWPVWLRMKTRSKAERRAAIGRCAELQEPNSRDICLALQPKKPLVL